MNLLEKIKPNLTSPYLPCDSELAKYISTAIYYAESIQNRPKDYFSCRSIPPYTKQAIILLVNLFLAQKSNSIENLMASKTSSIIHSISTINDLLSVEIL